MKRYASEDAVVGIGRSINMSEDYNDEGNESDSTISEFYEGRIPSLCSQYAVYPSAIKCFIDETLNMDL